MGCSCKNVKKIQNLIPNANHSQIERKGVSRLFYMALDSLQKFLIKLLILTILIVAFPIVFLVIVFNLFYQGKPTIPMPKKIVESLIRNKNES